MKLNKNDKSKSGIYCIKNQINGKVYIGKTKDLYVRIRQHVYQLRYKSLDENRHLINAWYKYGEEAFEYFVIEYLSFDEELLKTRELYWQKKYNSLSRKYGYNLRSDSSTNCVVHKETSELISKRLKKEWAEGVRKDHGKKLSDNWKTTPERNQEQSKIMSKTLTKYSYNLYDINEVFIENCLYEKLVELGLKNCMATFHKKKTNKILFKSYIIEKLIIKDIV